MAQRIEDYALIGDTQTAALVGRDGSIDWLCAPRFDSGAVFAALLGDREQRAVADRAGRRAAARSSGSYRDDTLVLETTFHTDDGDVQHHRLHADPRHDRRHRAARSKGVSGRVPMHMD